MAETADNLDLVKHKVACDVAINWYLSHKLVFFHWIQTVWDFVKNWLLRKGSFFQAEKLHQISSSRRGEPMCWQHRRVELGDSLLAGNRLPLEETRTHHSGNKKLSWEKSRQRKQPPQKSIRIIWSSLFMFTLPLQRGEFGRTLRRRKGAIDYLLEGPSQALW